jgi:curved DNA-binding protein CbpA
MDPYSTLGVSRVCTREQVKEAFRSLVHRAHPDRGGDGQAFVRLCAAYREVMNELERGDDRDLDSPGPVSSGRRADAPRFADSSRGRYVAWLRQVSAESARRRPTPWWRKNPALAKAWLLGLIGLGGVLVLCGTLALGIWSGRAVRRGDGRDSDRGRGARGRPVAGGSARTDTSRETHSRPEGW